MNNEENKKIENDLEECKKQCEEYLNGWKRAKADFINYQKDEAKRFEEMLKFGQGELIRELLGILDSFDLATDLPKGAALIRQQLEEILKRQGVETIPIQSIKSGEGAQQADPAFHEVIEEIESEEPAGTILEEVVKGYTLNGRVIRPTKVKVAKSKQ
ncbi:MAG: nucleotide exchange factor GrpE [Patescibacteria group bacterium]